MASQTMTENSAIIETYLDQPTRLPADLRTRIERQWGGEPVQLYALADLDASLKLTRTWLAIGPRHVALAGEDGQVRAFERSRIKGLRKTPGLSCTTVTIQDAPGEPALGVVRYTHRQRRAMENVQYLIDEQLKCATGGLTTSAPRDATAADADEVYVNSTAHAVKEAQASVAEHKLAVIWRLMAYLRPYQTRLAWGIAAATLMTLISLVPPFLTGYMLDKVIRPSDAGALDPGAASHVAWLLIAGIAATYLVREAFVCIRLRTLAVLGELVARDIRNELYEHLQTLSLTFFSGKRTGSLISRVTSDTDRLWEFLAFGVVETLLAGVMLVALGGVLICLDWRLGLMMALPVPLLFWAIYWQGERMQRIFLRAWRKWSRVTDVLSDTIPGVRVVKAFHQEDQEKKRFAVRNTDVTEEFNRIHAAWTTFWPLLMAGIHLLLIGIWVFGLPRVLHLSGWGGLGGAPLSSGTFIAFLLYSGMFAQPIETIGMTSRMLHRATSSAHRIFEVLDTQPEIADVENAMQLEPVRGRVTFENVSFAYDGVRQILKGITFDVQPGEMVGLVGPSGAGKTTVTNLIVRFYEATGGLIRIDGVSLNQLDTGHFRRQVGMVLQDPYLFHGSIVDNIRYGMPEAKMPDVIAASKAANSHDFICKLPYGYDTIVGERGHTLSGGERQRVSIARAVLTNPRILILDEATSSVDTETERKIQEALDRLIAGRTVFAIAHRLSTLKRANRLFVIEDGRLAEQGTHAELLAKENGIYRKLHNLQQELHEMYAV